MRVKKLPQLLALHLKRFKYVEQLSRYTKLSYRVLFPLELRLFNVVSFFFYSLFLHRNIQRKSHVKSFPISVTTLTNISAEGL